MKQQNIKRLIREEVRRAVRYEVGRALKRLKVVVESLDDDVPDTEPAPPVDANDAVPPTDPSPSATSPDVQDS